MRFLPRSQAQRAAMFARLRSAHGKENTRTLRRGLDFMKSGFDVQPKLSRRARPRNDKEIYEAAFSTYGRRDFAYRLRELRKKHGSKGARNFVKSLAPQEPKRASFRSKLPTKSTVKRTGYAAAGMSGIGGGLAAIHSSQGRRY